jgi:hypothetical protein
VLNDAVNRQASKKNQKQSSFARSVTSIIHD